MEWFGYVLAVAVAGYFLYWLKGKIDAKKGNKGTGKGGTNKGPGKDLEK